ncbi:VOC family protein [Edaphobacter bradus]|uniref:VOC family protein n=1 Tax=Edaphobacter bradus TaxID=2259016 RepID=UPI0021E00456|nr:VOC family protein [Edaphobacter bradus]
MSTQTPEQAIAQTPTETAVRTHAINWFEIPCDDLDRATEFYETVLGAKMHRESQSARSIFATDPTGTGGMLVKRGYRRPGRGGALVYLNCDGILDAVLSRVARAGGLILMPKTEVPGGYGHFACMRDSEGNHIGLHSH